MSVYRRSLFLTICILFCFTANVCLAKKGEELYEELGISKTATQEEVKKAFRKMTRENHPDTKEEMEEKEKAKEIMSRVLRAYEVLGDEQKRSDYDKFGVIPGETLNPDDYTTEELFEYFHQQSPITSRVPTLDSFTLLRRMMRFRGRRIFVLHLYGDDSNACRQYAPVWDGLYYSALVQAGVMELYRIDGQSAEGQVLAEELGLQYKGEAQVVALIDGTTWNLHGISNQLKTGKSRFVFQHLQDFAIGFFYQYHQNISSLTVKNVDTLLELLRRPRDADQPHIILFPKVITETIPIAIQMHYPQSTVLAVPRQELRLFVEEFCGLELSATDRDGNAAALSEFVVLSTSALGGTDSFEEGKNIVRECGGIHIGVSSSLTFEKADSFLKEHIPPVVPGMKKLPMMDDLTYWPTCREKCMLWVRQDCSAEPTSDEAHIVSLFSVNKAFLGFKTGFVCASASLWEHLHVPSGQKSTFVALQDGDDEDIFVVHSLSAVTPGELTGKLVEQSLGLTENSARRISLHPLSLGEYIVGDAHFPIDHNQRYWDMFNAAMYWLLPSLTSFGPFLLMYFLQKRFFPLPDPGAAPQNDNNNNDANENNNQ
ncbi:DNAJ domain protein [Angomonas deanei]|uniref:DnaJ domain containing protein, putative n=1 Tax=Angomonas deanei TaxID=59799 RepID=A0A7G2CMY9_9TRYP|nr:DNAJ domain protein [Angomonas deanei]CAD2219933.1 DnaJ domain containing protein, putative [Angomonas deanei]|eukprot:EPY24249.1 DNAJ domain protein [Angomonas deanei]